MRPKTKDAERLNLYLDRRVVEILDRLSAEDGLSRSAIVEKLVRQSRSVYPEISGGGIPMHDTPAKKLIKKGKDKQ